MALPTPPPLNPMLGPQGISPVAQAVNESINPDLEGEQRAAREQEYDAVKSIWKQYEDARKFDKQSRGQYAIDRFYAAGTADLSWAVNTNLIGSYIDILTSFLYAKNPDVSVRKSPKVNNDGTKADEDFARTMELVISSLWKKAQLKRIARKQVRSSLSVGPGWLKVVLISDNPNQAQMENEMNDLRKNLADLEASRNAMLDEARFQDATEKNAEIEKQNQLMDSLTNKVEASIRKYLAVDFVSAEDMQVSLDVRNVADYLDADWNANAIYRPRDSVKALFPDLTDDELKTAKSYYQRKLQTTPNKSLTDIEALAGMQGTPDNADEAEQYTSGVGAGSTGTGDQGPEFVKVVELWDKRTNHIDTMIEGVKCWAKPPYQPAYPSSRFYPYFYLAFYEVDGARHPQSLSWRLRKLQDEYARTRSNFRVTRERSIPAVMFNAGAMDEKEAKKIEQAVAQEFIALKPTIMNQPLGDMFTPKPVASYDPRIYDTQPILTDMEKISGVQEALSSSVSQAKTATEANIQQTGFSSRTDADRDVLEMMLTDMANYTGECALSALSVKDVQRICGASAFWPAGMALDDLLTMVEIQIEAGTTGKPKQNDDKEAWGVLLPTLQDTIMKIEQAIMMGNLPLAKALRALCEETMRRMGDDTDLDRFVPEIPEPPQGMIDPVTGQPMPPMPPPRGVPPEPGEMMPGPGAGPGGPGEAAALPPAMAA